MRRILCSVLLPLLCCAQTAYAQNFTLTQLIALHNQGNLPAVATYLEQRGWQFSESFPEKAIDQVSWIHRQPTGGRKAVINVMFCNQAVNTFCEQGEVHNDNGQHAFLVLYQPNTKAFQALKQQAQQLKMELTTSIMENGLSYKYTGANYMMRLNMSHNSDGSLRYFVELRRKGSDVVSE